MQHASQRAPEVKSADADATEAYEDFMRTFEAFKATNDDRLGEIERKLILPLSRGSDGRLGVRSEASSAPLVVNFHVTAPDAESFRKSEAQLTAMLARAVGRGRRGL